MTMLPLGILTEGNGAHTVGVSMLGLELGPSAVRAALVERGKVLRRHDQALPIGASPDVVIDAIVRAAAALDPNPRAAGLAIPGELDGNGRCWGMLELPGFDGVYIAEELAARLGCPVAIESQGQSAAWGERLYGRGRGHASLLSVLVGSRLSAGLVLDGQLRRGRAGFGAGIAHLCVDTAPSARVCVCGRCGCLDAYASLRALELDYASRSGNTAAAAEIVEAASSAGTPALEAVSALASALGAGLASIQNMLDLDAISVSTPLPGLFALLEPRLREILRASVFGLPAAEIPVLESVLGADAALVGATELALRGINDASS